MATWPDPRSVSVGFAFGSSDADDPDAVSYTTVSPGDDPDTGDDPGVVRGTVRVTRGRVGNRATTDATLIEFEVDNGDGAFSPRNVSGKRYGQLRSGTPVQVELDRGIGNQTVARAFVPEWNPTWRGPGIDEILPISALGVLSRIGRDQESMSAIKRTVLSANPLAYWPLEDGLDADVAGPGTPDAGPLRVIGTISFGSDEGLPGSLATPDMTAGGLAGSVPAGGSSTAWFFEFWVNALYNTGARAASITTSSPGMESWGIRQPDSASGQIEVFVEDSSGGSVGAAVGPVTGWAEGVWHHIAIVAEQNGSNVDVSIYGDGQLLAVNIINSVTLGRITAFSMNDIVASDFAELLSVAHVVVGNGDTPTGSAAAGDGYAGETAGDRIVRLCAEAGIPIQVPGDDSDSEPMGVQGQGSFLQLLRECESADHGVLFEQRNGRLAYHRRAFRYNAAVEATLTYGTEDEPGTLSDLVQVDDNRDLYNLVNVSRPNGASAVAQLRDGPVGTDAIGPRPLSVRLNVASDGRLAAHAGWLLRWGTLDKPRYVIALDMYSTPSLAATALFVDISSRIRVTGAPPQFVGPDDLDLIIEGEELEIGADRGLVTWWCEPYAPYDVGTYQDTDASGDVPRYDTEWSTTSGDFLTGTDTTLTVATSAGPLWTTAPPNGFPILVKVRGITLTVSSITGSSSPQTFTISAANVSGVTIPSGSQVRVARPGRYAL